MAGGSSSPLTISSSPSPESRGDPLLYARRFRIKLYGSILGGEERGRSSAVVYSSRYVRICNTHTTVPYGSDCYDQDDYYYDDDCI